MKDCSHYSGLLMGLIDNELTPAEIREINDHMIRCEQCRTDYEELRETSNKIDTVAFEEPSDEILDNLWKTPFNRFTRNAGLVLVLSGYLMIMFYAVFEFLVNTDEAVFPRIFTAAIFIGFLILLGNVIMERLTTYKSDPYREVKR